MLIGIDARMYGFSGIGTYLKVLLKGLGEIDSENQYICYLQPGEASMFPPPGKNFSIKTWDVPIYSIREQISLPLQIAREPFDIFHFPHYAFPVFAPCRSVITIHDIIHYLFPEYLPNRFAHYYAKFMISYALRQGSLIITDSENTKGDLIKNFKVDPKKIRRIYPGLPGEPLVQNEKERETAVLNKLGIKKPFLLYVGNGKEHKNIPMLIRAYHAVKMKFPCNLVISCKKEEIKGLKEAPGNWEQDVTFLRYVEREELDAVYRNASVFVFPSLYEGFGYPPLEAMAHGLPVVCSDSSSLPEVVGDAALLVSPGSIDLLADSIYNVLTDDNLRRSLIEKGIARCAKFDCRAMAEETLQAYREAAGK